MKKRKIPFLLYFLFFITSILSPSRAASLEDLVILTEDYPPYNYRSKQGELSGISVELLKKAFKMANATLDLNKIRVQPWPRSYRQAQAAENFMLFSVSRVPFREKLFKWAGPIVHSEIVLYAKKSRAISIREPNDLSHYIIGGILEDIGYQLMRRMPNFNGEFILSPSPDSLIKMLASERIDLLAYDQTSAKFVFLKNNLNPQDYEQVYTLTQAPLYFAFSLNTDQQVVDKLQAAINTVKYIDSL